jgi:hypothetical protein
VLFALAVTVAAFDVLLTFLYDWQVWDQRLADPRLFPVLEATIQAPARPNQVCEHPSGQPRPQAGRLLTRDQRRVPVSLNDPQADVV